MHTLFVNCHIPKTAGTSLISAFQGLFGEDRCLVQLDPSEPDFLAKIVEHASQIDFASGHITIPEVRPILDVLSARGIDVKLVTSIRDPIRLFVSAFFHTRRFFDVSEKERDASLPEFLYEPTAYPTLKLFSTDSACKYLSGDIERYSGARSLATALTNLASVDFVFDADDLQSSFDGFREKFGFTKVIKIQRLNENSVKGGIRDYYDLLPAIADLNKFDCKLFQFASSRLVKGQAAKYSDDDGGIYVSEAIRRVRHEVVAQQTDFFEFRNNDLLLHLPKSGKTELSSIEPIFSTNGYLKFATEIDLDQRAVSEAAVEISILSDVFGSISAVKNVIPGKTCWLTLETNEIYGPCRIALSSRIEQGTSNDFGMLWLVAPRVFLK